MGFPALIVIRPCEAFDGIGFGDDFTPFGDVEPEIKSVDIFVFECREIGVGFDVAVDLDGAFKFVVLKIDRIDCRRLAFVVVVDDE